MVNRRPPPKAKKSVSFSDIPTQVDFAEKASQSSSTDLNVHFSTGLAIIPYHYLLILWTLFKNYDITSDEVSAMKRSLPLLICLQAGYGYLIHFNIKKKKKEVINILYIIASILISLTSSVLIFAILILFGAPFLSLSTQTYLLSLHLSLIVVYPLLITFKFVDFTNFKEYCETVIKQFNLKNEIYIICAGGVVGTWLGCFPIPLDWDRDWQTWPITLLAGGYLGCVIGGIAAFVMGLLL